MNFTKLKKALGYGALLLLLDDITAWMDGKESVIGRILGPYQDFAAAVQSVADGLSNFFEVLAKATSNAHSRDSNSSHNVPTL